MEEFILGVIVGQLSAMIAVAILLRNKGGRRMMPRRKVDGIWTVREDTGRKPVDPSRTRVRKAVFLERTRRG